MLLITGVVCFCSFGMTVYYCLCLQINVFKIRGGSESRVYNLRIIQLIISLTCEVLIAHYFQTLYKISLILYLRSASQNSNGFFLSVNIVCLLIYCFFVYKNCFNIDFLVKYGCSKKIIFVPLSCYNQIT